MSAEKQTGKYLPPDETSMFCEQVALILKSGIPLYDGIETLCETYDQTRYADTFKRMEAAVKENGNLFSAVSSAGVFPPYMVEMVRIGEAAGKLDDVMEGLSQYYAREAKMRSAIKSAIVYPVVLVLMMAVVIGVLVSQVLPIFDRVFRNLGTEMNASMAAVMNFGMVTGRVVLVLIAALLVLLIVGFILYRSGHRALVMRVVMRLFPPVRRVAQKTGAGRFASVMSMMMTAGFPIGEAIDMAPGVVTDDETRTKIEKISKSIKEDGQELPKAIAEGEVFEPIYNKMIQVGYYAGQMDRVMGRLGEIYEEEIDDGIRRLVGLIEPTLVAVLAIVIGGILLAVMLPLASIMSSIL